MNSQHHYRFHLEFWNLFCNTGDANTFQECLKNMWFPFWQLHKPTYGKSGLTRENESKMKAINRCPALSVISMKHSQKVICVNAYWNIQMWSVWTHIADYYCLSFHDMFVVSFIRRSFILDTTVLKASHLQHTLHTCINAVMIYMSKVAYIESINQSYKLLDFA